MIYALYFRLYTTSMNKIFFFSFFLLLSLSVTGEIFAQEALDLRAGYQSLLENSKEGGNLHTLPKSLVAGDLYRRSYQLAERNLSKVVIESLDQTHKYLAQVCDNNL